MSEVTTPEETPAEPVPATTSPDPTETPAVEPIEVPVEPTIETPEPAPDPTPEPTVAEKAKKWDFERQKRDEARAAKQKTLEDAVEAQALRQKQLEDEIAVLKAAKTPPPPAPPTADELSAMAEKVETLNDPANDKYDPDEGRKVENQLRKATFERQRSLDERLRRQEAKDDALAAEFRWWGNWEQKNPEADVAQAKAFAESQFKKYAARYQGDALGNRVSEELDANVDQFKKSKSPPPRPSVATRPPTSASVSAPVGTRVVPANSGARPAPAPDKAYYDALAEHLRQVRAGA